MARFLKNREKSKGLAPGTLVFIGEKKLDGVRIRLIDYNESNLNEKKLENISEGNEFIETSNVSWINIDGLHDLELMKSTASAFGLHSLLMEDIMNTGQRPKFEEFGA